MQFEATTSDKEVEKGNAEEKADGSTDMHQEMPLDKMLRVGVVALFSALGSTLFGLDIGYIGPIIESRSFEHDVAHIDRGSIPDGQEGFIVSLFSIGAMVTAFPVVSSYFIDEWGRKPSIMLGSLVFVIGSLIQATSTSMYQLFVGRFVAGMSIGLLSSVIVLYQCEMAPASMRGALSTLYQLGITFGILMAAFIDQMVVEHDEGWRWVMGIISLPAVLLIIGMVYLPRSPRWLVSKGRREEAKQVLKTIRPESEAIKEEQEIYEEIQKSKAEGDPKWSELCHGRIARLLCLGVTLQLLQQLVGMNAFMYFGPKIFKSIGFSANTFNTINNFVNFLSTLPAVLLADKLGRRSLMLASSIGMAVACGLMGLMGLLFVHQELDPMDLTGTTKVTVVDNDFAGWVIAISAFFFVFNFAFGFGPIVWVCCAEIFPLRYRARSLGVTTLANWVGNFIIAQFTPMLLETIQFNTFFVFGFFCAVGVLLSSWLPETKGVPLENIQTLFDNKVGFKSTAAEKHTMKVKAKDSSNSDSD